jgi:hypothetical protein
MRESAAEMASDRGQAHDDLVKMDLRAESPPGNRRAPERETA